ncbi:MAG: YraN family protein [Anaerolineae bacterium]|jgi:putative endonuclease|nr:YraN family protein [Anaerolineae bacterium]MDH7472613.1 YraN family protein [Anaerolineae bacterium]
MTRARKRLGDWGEDLALHYLQEQGYEIRARNYRYSHVGEIDLVAERDGQLVFVEVRTRRGNAYGTPEESITSDKQDRLIAVAQAYVQEHNWQGDWRIDVVAVELSPGGRLPRVTHIPSAVEG